MATIVVTNADGSANVADVRGYRKTHPELAGALDYAESRYDADPGLERMGVRDYAPSQKQFAQPDPLFFQVPELITHSPVDANLYSYAGNNPVNFSDPSGPLQEQPDDCKGNPDGCGSAGGPSDSGTTGDSGSTSIVPGTTLAPPIERGGTPELANNGAGMSIRDQGNGAAYASLGGGGGGGGGGNPGAMAQHQPKQASAAAAGLVLALNPEIVTAVVAVLVAAAIVYEAQQLTAQWLAKPYADDGTFTPEAREVVKDAKDARKEGTDDTGAQDLLDRGEEAGLDVDDHRSPDQAEHHQPNGEPVPHIRIGPINHIPVRR